jgi:hypothetical protein
MKWAGLSRPFPVKLKAFSGPYDIISLMRMLGRYLASLAAGAAVGVAFAGIIFVYLWITVR